MKAEPTLAWLGQFEPEDQPVAVAILRAMMLVSRDAFAEGLRKLLLERLAKGGEPIGLYVERELRHRHGVPFRLFKETTTKVRRAYGVGPRPVEPTQSYDADVGSEGLVAQLVSEICRADPKKVFNHPGPDAIRKHRIRRFVLVSDFIGSGRRAQTYLQSAWRVRSVRSWWSGRATKGLAFEVVAYAATRRGRSVVERHPSRPSVHVVVGCPTLDSAFSTADARKLCFKYSPVPPSVMPPMGYCGGGALIAFAHGVPNNAPLILHKRGPGWAPLFPARVTSATRAQFSDASDADTVRAHLLDMRQTRLATAGTVAGAKPHAQTMLLVLAALSRPPREAETISRKTGLTVLEVEAALKKALKNEWVDGENRLTDLGHAELNQARKCPDAAPLPPEAPPFYYPSSLRVPRGVSS
ncbi:hypothetical protein [Phenylobacterium sp.]|uniref:phosphoribosyltransferase-like protein n=1 Tax=Phenylobacterium sp. TaxID=1871053 RepID=UPI002730AB2B|nr:hypothetical protein [Phenylobacterium sp.]MDP1872901.1 hypothetical protein [Phenylobacterium sp.]